MNLTSRRRLLCLGLLGCTGAALPVAAFASPEVPAGLEGLTRQLARFSTWVRTKHGEGGLVEFHCGIHDASAWAGSFSKLAVNDITVRAEGNALTFTCEGRSVRVVMHSATA